MPRLIDTHAHLNFEAYDADRRQVIENSLSEGVFMINVGVNYNSSLQAVEISKEYGDGVWAAIGLHPENIDDDLHPDAKDFRKPAFGEARLAGRPASGEARLRRPEDIKEPGFNAELYRGLARSSKKVVAIGEIGLDYLRLPKNEARASRIRAKQAEIFEQQLALSQELGLPAIIHTRMAHKDTFGILEEFSGNRGSVNGVIHCFSGNVDEFRQYCGLGLYFGLNGIIFKLDLDEAIAKMPLDRILLETDCPFLSPPMASLAKGGPLPEIKRNEPVYAKNVAERVAKIRNDSVETIIEAATENAERLFGIG